MNRDPVTAILAGTLLLSTTLTAGLCYAYLHVSQNNQLAQREVARLNALRAVMQPLAAECLEFSRKHPSIIPVLQNLGVRSRTGETNVSAILQP
jgi:type II secretory pathway component PulJ